MDFWANDPWLYILALILIVSLIIWIYGCFYYTTKVGGSTLMYFYTTHQNSTFLHLIFKCVVITFFPYFFNGLRFVLTEWIIHSKIPRNFWDHHGMSVYKIV